MTFLQSMMTPHCFTASCMLATQAKYSNGRPNIPSNFQNLINSLSLSTLPYPSNPSSYPFSPFLPFSYPSLPSYPSYPSTPKRPKSTFITHISSCKYTLCLYNFNYFISSMLIIQSCSYIFASSLNSYFFSTLSPNQVKSFSFIYIPGHHSSP